MCNKQTNKQNKHPPPKKNLFKLSIETNTFKY